MSERVVHAGRVVEAVTVEDDTIQQFLVHVSNQTPQLTRRRLSVAQQEFRKQLLEGSTPRVVARKHVQEKWTHAYLTVKLAVMVVLCLCLIFTGYKCKQASIEEDVNSVVGQLMMACGVLMLCAAALGAYGAHRVRADIMVDDDGLGTPGQNLLQGYFHVAFTFNIVLFPVSVVLLADPDSFLTYGAYGDTEFYSHASAVLALVITVLSFVSLRPTAMIVTVYEISQSFLESFATILIALAVLGLLLCVSILDYGQFLGTGAVNSTILGTTYAMMGLCVMLVVLSILGFGAALIEHSLLLRLHQMAMVAIFFVMLVTSIVLTSVDMSELVTSNCRTILQVMSHEWWTGVVGCAKYGGAAIGAQVEVLDPDTGSYMYSIEGVGESTRCANPLQNAFAWEHFEPGSGTVPKGCLNEACCQILVNRLSQASSLMAIGIVLLLLCILINIKADAWLIRHTREQTERIKRVSQTRTRVLLGFLTLFIGGAALGIAFLGSPDSEQILPEEIVQSLNKDTLLQASPGLVSLSFQLQRCANLERDGNETDVDCGGDPLLGGCTSRCGIERQCLGDDDCVSQRCNATRGRCREQTAWEKCSNGIRDGLETSIDCGGGQCRMLLSQVLESSNDTDIIGDQELELDAAFLCPLAAACITDADCLSQSCDAVTKTCVDCQDGIKNAAEGDVDCGSPQCREYYRLFAPGASNTSNADQKGLCLDGSSCALSEQCASGMCHDGVCVSCFNGVQDGDETDVDCGGCLCENRCGVGQGCQHMYDCVTHRCTSSCRTGECGTGQCETVFLVAPGDPLAPLLGSSTSFTYIAQECSDGILSSHEADVDCGGSLCVLIGNTCDDGRSCASNGDCSSNQCFDGKCVSCRNQIQDGGETDVDCGGTTCPLRCERGSGCMASSDCTAGHFCWTATALNFTLAFARDFNVSDETLQDVFIPPAQTCQPLTTLNVDIDDTAFFVEGASLSTIYSQITLPVPQVQVVIANSDNNDTDALLDNSTSRRILGANDRRNRRRRLHALGDHADPVVGGLANEASLTNPWKLLCPVTSTFKIEEGNKFVVESANGADVQVLADRTLVIKRTWDSLDPDVRIFPTRCDKTHEDGITITRTDQTSCHWLFVAYGSNLPVATFRIASSTRVSGRVHTNDDVPVAGAFVRLFSRRRGACTNAESDSASCDGASCSTMDHVFDGCHAAAPCCKWRETEGIATSACAGNSEQDTGLIATTDADGYYLFVIPEFVKVISGTRYRFGYTVTHDHFVSSTTNTEFATPGGTTLFPDLYIAPQALEPCGCNTFESTDLENAETLCKNPVNRHCIAREGSCTGILGFMACDNTITFRPTKPKHGPLDEPKLVADERAFLKPNKLAIRKPDAQSNVKPNEKPDNPSADRGPDRIPFCEPVYKPLQGSFQGPDSSPFPESIDEPLQSSITRPNNKPYEEPHDANAGTNESALKGTDASAHFDSCDFEWLMDVVTSGQRYVEDVAATETGDRYFAGIGGFAASWTESFFVDVEGLSECDNMAIRDLKDSIVEARCGEGMFGICSVDEVQVLPGTETFEIKMSFAVDLIEFAILLDRAQGSPITNADTDRFGTALIETYIGCWRKFATISAPYNATVQGHVSFDVRVENLYAFDIDGKVCKMQEAIGRVDLSDPEYFRRFPCAENTKTDFCPTSRVCSGRGVCCDQAAQISNSCPESTHSCAMCWCNDGWGGYNCEDVEAVGSNMNKVKPCGPAAAIGGLGGASEALVNLCAQPSACDENPLLCEYQEEQVADEGCPDGEWLEVFRQRDCSVTLNLGEPVIDGLFQLRKSWRYDIEATPYLYYQYLDRNGTTFPEGFSPYSLMLDNWASLDGEHLLNEHFALYGSAADLARDENRWLYSNYDDNVGFPRDANPGTAKSSAYFYKWAKSYCGIPGRKVSFVKDFGFSLCVPFDTYAPGNLLDQPLSQQTYTVQGMLSDAFTGLGVQARVRLFHGRNPVFEGLQPSRDVSATFTFADAKGSLEGAGATTCASSDIDDEPASGVSTVWLQSSSFAFEDLLPGEYTLVVSHAPGAVAASLAQDPEITVVGNDVGFHTAVQVFAIQESDQTVNVQVIRQIPEGSIVAVFETLADDLELVVEFDADTEGERCTVSKSLLSDGACECSGVKLIRAHSPKDSTAKTTQVLQFENFRDTVYKFFVGRGSPIPTSKYKKHRDDGRCGPLFPLETGEPSQCPPVAVMWEDGTTGLRPCCHITKGFCGSSLAHCESRFSIDYRMFLTDDWMEEYRSDGRCNRPDMLSPSGKTATCPREAPCCSPQAKCGSLAYHCTSDRSISYKPFYEGANAAAANVSALIRAEASEFDTESLDVLTGLLPLEESGLEIRLFSSDGVGNSFGLPDPLEKLNYLDGHEYKKGEATVSSGYMRAFCIDATHGSPQAHEYPAPRFFQWKGELMGMSATCPSEGTCEYLRLSRLRAPGLRSDGVTTPELSGTYFRRYQTTEGYNAHPGFGVSHNADCRAHVLDPRDGRSRWSMHAAELGVLDERTCMTICSESDECELVFFQEYLNWNTQVFNNRCTFHKSIHLCGGINEKWFGEVRERVVFEKRSSSQRAAVWYTRLDTMFLSPEEQVHLYRDETLLEWYIDNDLVPSNGHYAFLPAATDSELPPSVGWRHVLNFEEKQSYTQPTPVQMLAYKDDCAVGGNFPTLNGTAEARGCQCDTSGTTALTGGVAATSCFGFDSCETFHLRIVSEFICVEASPYRNRLMSNLCSTENALQQFIFNKVLQQLEVRALDGSR
ncbi:Uncharacterized protein SCF082_LOCUS52318 [Durusdinium trenchii]|uniref:Uncharacterized protein n=1 Tax=Durusdinium trenchii TaxID=1381693 RepID=A0ABP0SKG4_9DINO